MNTAPCKCEARTTRPSVNERPRYYARQLITPDDMTLEQDYFRAKLRRHNRFLHGWGVVCGAEVVEASKPWKLIVRRGYVLAPSGDEIYVEKDECVDVRRSCAPPEPQLLPDDPDCVEAQPPPPADGPLFVAIRYKECPTHLVRVPLGGCGCEENACEYSRFTDHYEICILDHCPDSHEKPAAGRGVEIGDGEGRETEVRDDSVACPECPDEPWVVLGEFTVDDDGKVTLEETGCRWQLAPPRRFVREPAARPTEELEKGASQAATDTRPAPTPAAPTPPAPSPAAPAEPAAAPAGSAGAASKSPAPANENK